MSERDTERAPKVFLFARHEASPLGSGTIEMEHVLPDLSREGECANSRLLSESHPSPAGLATRSRH